MRSNFLKRSKQAGLILLALFMLFLNSCANRYASVRQELENRNFEQARKQVLVSYPHDGYYNMLLAEVSYYLKDYDTFVESLTRSLRQSDRYRDDLLYLMRLADTELTDKAYQAFDVQDYDTARHLIDLVLRIRYYLDWVMTPLGDRALTVSELLEYSTESLVKEGRYDEARTQLLHLTGDSLRSLNVRERLAYIYFASKQYYHTNDLLKEILTPQPGGAGLLLFTDQLKRGDYITDSVLTSYVPLMNERKLIERPLMDSHLGSSFYDLNDWVNSRLRFEMVLRTDPGNAVDFLALIGESYFLEHNFEKAVEVFEQAYMIAPNNEDVLQYLAISRFNLGQREIADSLFSVARSMQSNTILDPTTLAPGDTTMPQRRNQ